MIHLAAPEIAPDRAVLDAPGGFLWWYVDLVDAKGDGLVLIWSFGLPFLPGYADAARAGRAPTARSRPSVNLAVYQGGRSTFYLLQEYPPGDAAWLEGGQDCVIGASRFSTRREGDVQVLEVELDAPLPGSKGPLRGRIEARGPAVRPEGALAGFGGDDHTHAWSPLLTAAEGRAALDLGGVPLRLEGRVYHDRNASPLPLHDLGIAHWIWGRCPFPDRERIFYLVWPKAGGPPRVAGLEVHPDGRLTEVRGLEVDPGPERRTIYGMTWWPQVRLSAGGEPWLEVDQRQLVDNGPFYLRSLLRGRAGGVEVVGVGEAVAPDRVDLDTHRHFVKMAVHDLNGGNSLLLPLFSGPRSGRVSRYFSNLMGGTRP